MKQTSLKVKQDLKKKAKSARDLEIQVTKWKDTFERGAMGNHEAYNEARDTRHLIEDKEWIKLSDVKQILDKFITKEDWLNLKICVECAFVQTKDEPLHIIASRLLTKLLSEGCVDGKGELET